MVGGALLLGHVERAHPEPLAERAREGGRGVVGAGDRGRGRPRSRWSPSGKVCRGCSEKVAAPAAKAGSSAASVPAPLTWPTSGGSGSAWATSSQTGSIAPSGTQSRTAVAPAAGVGRIGGGREPRRDAGRLGGGGEAPSHAAATDQDDRRVGGGLWAQFPFQFPHRRYQTALLVTIL